MRSAAVPLSGFRRKYRRGRSTLSTSVALIAIVGVGLRFRPNVAPDISRRLSTAVGFGGESRPEPVAFDEDGVTAAGLRIEHGLMRSLVLTSDGRLRTLSNSTLRSSNRPFAADDARTLATRLRREFPDHQVFETSHFLIAQPHGTGDQWAYLFENTYAAVDRVMRRCGVATRRGAFPMVAVVAGDREECAELVERRGESLPRGVVGFYGLESNRVYTYGDIVQRTEDTETVRHEAAHQVAFNVGIHSRTDLTPAWMCEGLGTLFESEGMASGYRSPYIRDRAVESYVRRIRSWDADRWSDTLTSIIESDRAFADGRTVHDAYAAAYGLSFYLQEHRPKTYGTILRTSFTDPETTLTPPRRRETFERQIGGTIGDLAENLWRCFRYL